MIENDIPPCSILIDKEGRWFHKGLEMIRRDIIQLFYRNMLKDSKGRYIVAMAGEQCYVDVEDTPFVVWRTVNAADRNGTRFTLVLSDDSKEDLDPETLEVGEKNVLYCKVRNGDFPARFSRPAYYQLAEYIEEENGDFLLPVNGRKYPIRNRQAEERGEPSYPEFQ